jgi:hypothetical protein
MKKIFISAVFVLSAFLAKAQVPQKMNYQAVARNTVGQPIANANINVRISILDLTSSGTAVYTEIRKLTTNQLGLFTAPIGGAGATSTTGSFANINWSTGNKFIKVEADPLGGTNFITLGNNELLSVPYALYAVNGKVGPTGATGPANVLNIGTVTNGAAGSAATATITGTSPTQTLNLTLPTGVQGPQGMQGIQGATGATGPIGSTGKNTLILTTTEAAGANCATGGVKQEYGVDANSNGTLEAGEVNATLTKYICNGLAGTVLNAWSTNGNTGTTGANFIGTTDAKDVSLKTNNTERVNIKSNGDVNIATSGGKINVSNEMYAAQSGTFNMVPLGIINIYGFYNVTTSQTTPMVATNVAGNLLNLATTTYGTWQVFGNRASRALSIGLNTAITTGYSKIILSGMPGLGEPNQTASNSDSYVDILNVTNSKIDITLYKNSSEYKYNANYIIYGIK